MLQKLGDHITACAERAEQCKAAAAVTTDPWLNLSYPTSSVNGGMWRRAMSSSLVWNGFY